MDVIGGSYGASGIAEFHGDVLKLYGAVNVVIRPSAVESVSTRAEKYKEFSIPLFLFSFLAFGLLGWFLGGLIGIVVALVVSIAWAYAPVTRVTAEVRLHNGKSVTLECSAKEANRLVRFSEKG